MNVSKIILVIATLFFFSAGNVNAGGDYSLFRIESVVGSAERALISLSVIGRQLVGIDACDSIEVELNYDRVPWFSFLPFVDSSHPTIGDTNRSLDLLSK